MAMNGGSPAVGGVEGELVAAAGTALAKSEHQVDRLLRRLGLRADSGEKALRRLDRAFLATTMGAGVVKGVGTAGRKSLKIPGRMLSKVSTIGLLSATALYITAQARLRGISTSDPRVHDAMRQAMLTSAMLPAGQAVIEGVSKFARGSTGLPTDPRTWAVMATGAAVGGYSGNALGQQIVAQVNSTLGPLGPQGDASDPELRGPDVFDSGEFQEISVEYPRPE